jgi:hypothetical protein
MLEQKTNKVRKKPHRNIENIALNVPINIQ